MLALDAFKGQLTAIFQGTHGFPADDAATGTAWAAAYRAFVADAEAGHGGPRPIASDLDRAQPRLAAGLQNAFRSGRAAGSNGVAVVTPLLEIAFVSFWMGNRDQPAPVGFASPGAGAVFAITSALAEPLGRVFLAGVPTGGTAPSARTQAHAVATALDEWTKGVEVTYAPPTGATGTLL